jgi:lipopolysaccharide/colanic/teichoic acid biosynthesis glycosyltransferase
LLSARPTPAEAPELAFGKRLGSDDCDDEPELTGAWRAGKAIFDRAIASVLLIVCSPLLIATAIAIWAQDHRRPFFKQIRVGRDGREFSMWKFRSMKPDAQLELDDLRASNDHDGLLSKMRTDPRVTPVGRWLRRHSADELPQLWNVLRGDMLLVGPRPALPNEVDVSVTTCIVATVSSPA